MHYSIELRSGSPDDEKTEEGNESYSSDLSASERGDLSIHSQMSDSLGPLTSPLPSEPAMSPSHGRRGSLRELFFSAHSSSSRTSFRNSLHSLNNNSYRLEGLDEEGDDNMMGMDDETSLEFAEVGLSEYDENHIAFTRKYNSRHGKDGDRDAVVITGREGTMMDLDAPFSSMSDLQGTQRSMDMSGFFDALEEQYMEALESSTSHSKKTPSIRFADEVELVYDVESSGNTHTDIMPITDRDLDVYDEMKDRQRLSMLKGDSNDLTSLQREPSMSVFDGDNVPAVGLAGGANLIDDDDASSIYEELVGDGNSDDDNSQDDEEKKIIKGILYSAGGAAFLAAVGFAAKQVMNIISNGGDDDVVGGAPGTEMYHGQGADQIATVTDVAHAGETTVEAVQAAQMIGDAANASFQGSLNMSQSLVSSSSTAASGSGATSGAAGATGSTQVVQNMSVAAAQSAGNR
jgi:hypothetical protein